MIDKDSLYFIFLNVAKMNYQRTNMLLNEIGVYHGQPPLLFILEKHDGLSQKEIADILRIAPSTITVMLSRMEKAGLLARRQDIKDQRISRVYLTDKGRSVCAKAKESMNTLAKECFSGFSSEEKEDLRRYLVKMSNNFKKKLE